MTNKERTARRMEKEWANLERIWRECNARMGSETTQNDLIVMRYAFTVGWNKRPARPAISTDLTQE